MSPGQLNTKRAAQNAFAVLILLVGACLAYAEAPDPKNYPERKREEQSFSAKARGAAERGGIIRIGNMEFMEIKSGEFLMGSPEDEGESHEHPRHRVSVNSFLMGRYEVTQRQYHEIMSGRIEGKKGEYSGHGDYNTRPSGFKGDDRPVEKVDWEHAIIFCKRFGLKYDVECRLPYEAEWEYACRAGTEGRFPWGEAPIGEHCWLNDNSAEGTKAVGTRKPNAWGLHDMIGNVYEWCMDWYNERYYSRSRPGNPRGPMDGSYRIIRGGSWYDAPHAISSAHRYMQRPSRTFNNIGFRVVIVPR